MSWTRRRMSRWLATALLLIATTVSGQPSEQPTSEPELIRVDDCETACLAEIDLVIEEMAARREASVIRAIAIERRLAEIQMARLEGEVAEWRRQGRGQFWARLLWGIGGAAAGLLAGLLLGG